MKKVIADNYKVGIRFGATLVLLILGLIGFAGSFKNEFLGILGCVGAVLAFLAQDRLEVDLDDGQILLHRNLRYLVSPRKIPMSELDCLQLDFFDTSGKSTSWRTFTVTLRFKDERIRPFRLAQDQSLDRLTARLADLNDLLQLPVEESAKLEQERIDYELAGRAIREFRGPKPLQ